MQTLRLKPRNALPLFSRHPWVYATSLQKTADGSDLMPGLEVVVESDRGEPIARGLVNPNSLLRVRLYSWTPEEPITGELFAGRIRDAIAFRRETLGQIESCRLIFSEADGLSGLTVDSYDGYLLVQLTSAALASKLETLVSILQEQLSPPGMWLRIGREIADKERIDPADRHLRGEQPTRPLVIAQPGLNGQTVQYGVDLVAGQKTGFYYDQRENRVAVAALCRGKRVLDGHCYTGGFSVCIGATAEPSEVVGVDSSGPAIAMARVNADLNGCTTARFEEANIADWLAEAAAAGERFDVVILDPPKLAKSQNALNRAMKAYVRQNIAGLGVLEPGGTLVTHSCSGLVTGTLFDDMLQKVALETGRGIRILERRGAARDHAPSVFCSQTDYLKCRICRVD